MARAVRGTFTLADGAVRGDCVGVFAKGDVDQAAPTVIWGFGKLQVEGVEEDFVVLEVEHAVVYPAYELARSSQVRVADVKVAGQIETPN